MSPCDHEVHRDEAGDLRGTNEYETAKGPVRARLVRSGLPVAIDVDEIRRNQAAIVQVQAQAV